MEEENISKLNFYRDDELGRETLLLRFIQLETSMVFQLLRQLLKTKNGLIV